MTEEAALLALVVRRQVVLAGPRARGIADAVAELRREPALADVEHLVPAPRPVEAEHGPVGARRERVLELVAVVELRLRRHGLLERRFGDPPEAHERVAHLVSLLRQLHLVREVLETAAAARREVVARSLDAVGAGLDDLHRERLRVASPHLRHARAHDVPGQASAHEEDVAVEAPDAVASVRERVDLQLDLVTEGDGRLGHY